MDNELLCGLTHDEIEAYRQRQGGTKLLPVWNDLLPEQRLAWATSLRAEIEKSKKQRRELAREIVLAAVTSGRYDIGAALALSAFAVADKILE
jgi:hypothetical protein